jgi:hypothetical protein
MQYRMGSLFKKNFLFLLFIVSPIFAFANFDFNANCLKAYQNIFELKLGLAKQIIAAEKKIHPNNSIVPLLENYADYFYLITNPNKAEFDRLEGFKNTRIDQIADDDKASPYYLYAQAEINLQWALIRGRNGSYYVAAREINKANSLLQQNAKKFPNFHLNLKGLGLINAVLGSLPDGILKSTLATFGVTGNTQNGLAMLEKLADNLPKSNYAPFYEEVVFYYAYVLSDVVHSPSAYAKTMKYTARISDTSLLKIYLEAYVCARNNHTDEAIKILDNRPIASSYQSFPYLDYLMGIAKLNKLDFTATSYFNKFLASNKGMLYIKDAYLHLGWISLLKGNDTTFRTYLTKVRNNGYASNEKDKQALNEANSPAPHSNLLKARLLYDGGYLTKSLSFLSNVQADDFKTAKDKAEYYYRFGRVNDDLANDATALTSYQQSINLGKDLKYYYAAKSAMLMGKIYEKLKNSTKAKQSYNLAIAMKDHEFENSIENDAKQGLRRLGK